MEEHKEGVSSAWYMLGGLLVGAVAGLLLAPKAGSEAREDIKEWSRDKREKVRTMLSKVRGTLPIRVKAAAAGGALKSGTREFSSGVGDKAKQFMGS